MIPRRHQARAGASSARPERFRLRRGNRAGGPKVLLFGEGPPPNGAPSFRQSAQRFILGLAAILVIGTILLATPWTTASGQATPLIDAAFTAISAACITGLVTVDTQTHWNGF